MNTNISIQRVKLWCYTGSSDKVYNIELQRDILTGMYSVFFEYGKRGNGLISGYKVEGATERSARSKMSTLIRQKHNKEYETQSTEELKDLILHQAAAYANVAKKLKKDGHFKDNRYKNLINMLSSGDTETVVLAVEIIHTKQEVKFAA